MNLGQTLFTIIAEKIQVSMKTSSPLGLGMHALLFNCKEQRVHTFCIRNKNKTVGHLNSEEYEGV